MYTKTQIFSHLDELLNYCSSNGFSKTKLNTLVAPFELAVSNFFGISLDDYITKTITSLMHAGIRAGIVYDNYTITDASSEIPAAFNDITTVMAFMDSFMGTDGKTLSANIVETIPVVTDADAAGESIYTSTLVDAWCSTWTKACTDVPSQINAVFNYACGLALGSSLKFLIEAPAIKSVPALDEIAESIYITKKYKEFIQFYGLNVYVP